MTPLTAPMQAARQIIEHNEVVYAYRPLRRSVNKPLPISKADVTPHYSHGLNARTVEALISRGVVRLVAYTPTSGRVLIAE